MMTFDLSTSLGTWIANTTKNLAFAFETGGVGLPAVVAYSAKQYYTDVRNVTPPANGGTLASVALTRGKAKITVDMRKALRVVQTVFGKRLSLPLAWYLEQRWKKNGSQVKFNVTLSEFTNIEQELHRHVGYMQSGWNSALKKFGATVPFWVANKNGPGSVFVEKTMTKMIVKAENKVASIRSVKDMQRRIDWVSKMHKKRLESASVIAGNKILTEAFK